jgi:hypothetical protein
VRVEIDDPELVFDLVGFLKACQCEARQLRGPLVDASPPALDTELGKLQLEGFVHAWSAQHPGVTVHVR